MLLPAMGCVIPRLDAKWRSQTQHIIMIPLWCEVFVGGKSRQKMQTKTVAKGQRWRETESDLESSLGYENILGLTEVKIAQLCPTSETLDFDTLDWATWPGPYLAVLRSYSQSSACRPLPVVLRGPCQESDLDFVHGKTCPFSLRDFHSFNK